MAAEQIKLDISNAIKAFSSGDLTKNSMHLYQTLGYNTERSAHLSKPDFKTFKESYLTYNSNFNEVKAFVSEWKYVDLLFQLSKKEVADTLIGDFDGVVTKGDDKIIIETYLFFTIELKGDHYTRGNLSSISREVNKIFPMPVMILFRHNNSLTLSVINRRLHKRDETKDVLEKVTLIKDVNIEQPHRAHIEILFDLTFEELRSKYGITNFIELHNAWQLTLSITALNKKFYLDIIEWFDNAITEIKIPSQQSGSERHKDFVVRLIARLIFIWFLKELKVVKEELLLPIYFEGNENKLIKPKRNGSGYYKFILQNLFFNALNREEKERDKNVFDIYSSYFDDVNKIKDLIFFSPYLNGGLFDIHPDNDWCDFNKVNNAFQVPDELFLDKTQGLNSVFSKYKFTVAENTPLEEEIAVEPEMLGRIFENLLAEQSDDTKEIARKNAGAFYTPRPVVSYMCKNILLKHLDTEIKPENGKQIVHKLLETTVLDPACGSGAFPMSMLEEMMQILNLVDPDGKIWVSEIMKSDDAEFRNHISEMYADGQIRYVKKLGLLRNCLFGIDLLEYAVEITNLRCWLSLIIEQKVDFTKCNYNLKPLPNLEFKFYKKNSLFRFYKNLNLNKLVEEYDNQNLLQKLVNLENKYFITKSDSTGSKEEIKTKIIALLERIVESKSESVGKDLKTAQRDINYFTTNRGSDKEIKKAKKRAESLSGELAELVKFRDDIKDYFIERVVFPGIFSKDNPNPGFDLIIGNPPYVNTKLISAMGLTRKLEEEYGYCDDLYNHFTIRGFELLKKGGILSFICSDTFLTLQSKKNMRMLFLGLNNNSSQEGELNFDKEELVECKIFEVINTPKAFAALVDTAIFSIKKEEPDAASELIYIDIRKPNAKTFNITNEEWVQIKSSKENLAGWERILEKTFSSLGHGVPNWQNSHTCNGDMVYTDFDSSLSKYKISFRAFYNSINFAIFSPSNYNSQLLEKIVKPGKAIFDDWWEKIITSKEIENNRSTIKNYLNKLKPGEFSIIGLLTDGGVGLQTGDNGKFVGYKNSSRFADRCRITRAEKLWKLLLKHPKLKKNFKILVNCASYDDAFNLLEELDEIKIWQLFESIKEIYDPRIFGKGYIYRIIPDELVFNVNQLTSAQKNKGIKGKSYFVPYDKGDREGNRWYLETPYLIDWSERAVNILSTNEKARWQGYAFFFRNGFCWTNVLNPNSAYFKCRLKDISVNDVGSMSLYDELEIGDKYFVLTLNSYLHFKVLREFLNNTVNIQINDIRKLPIKIPNKNELAVFNKMFDKCLAVKKKYFAGKIERAEAKAQLNPLEKEIDKMVNRFYGIEVVDEIIEEELDEEMGVFLEEEDDE